MTRTMQVITAVKTVMILAPGGYIIKIYAIIMYYTNVIVSVRYFHPCLIFASKGRAYL